MDKLRKYARLPSLTCYAVFSQDGPEAYLWRKTDAGWPADPDVVQGLDAVIALPDVGATLVLSDIYARNMPQGANRP